MMRRYLWLVMITVLIALSAALPGVAQNPPPPAFATNTPAPPQPVISTPNAPINRFALRTWREVDLLDMLHTRFRQLTPGATELEKAITLLQYELQRRFPGAPRSTADREMLLHAALAAPPGSIDMRVLMRPYVEALVNQHGSLTPFTQDNLSVEVLPADIDGVEPQDAVLHVQSGDPPVYEDYLPVIASAAGGFRILPAQDLPAAPWGDLQSIELMGVGDFNNDGLDELAVSLDTGDLNKELRVFGWRGGNLVNLARPNSTISYGEVVDWIAGGTPLKVNVYREESSDWGCLGVQTVTWNWSANFFRPTPDPAGYFFQNSANCLFYGEEPIFAQPVTEAIAALNDILPFVPSDDDYSAQRAHMIQAMLKALDGDIGTGMASVLDLESKAEPGSWLAKQTDAFITALGTPGVTPLQVCAALVEAGPHGACNVDDALERMLIDHPLSREQSIPEQLAGLGITVQHQMTASEVGRVDRQLVHFRLAGDHWWAFAPLDREFYTAERAAPPPGYEPMETPLPVITAPQAMYDALLLNNDPATVLTQLGELTRTDPQAALSPEVRFLQALSIDLLADRTRARQAYYDLWQQSPLSIWGQLAAEHLEGR